MSWRQSMNTEDETLEMTLRYVDITSNNYL
jgi:hypothetical protein